MGIYGNVIQRNENNLTKYYPTLDLTQGQLKKEMSVVVNGMLSLTITIACVLFCLAGEPIYRCGGKCIHTDTNHVLSLNE